MLCVCVCGRVGVGVGVGWGGGGVYCEPFETDLLSVVIIVTSICIVFENKNTTAEN